MFTAVKGGKRRIFTAALEGGKRRMFTAVKGLKRRMFTAAAKGGKRRMFTAVYIYIYISALPAGSR